MLCTLNWNTKLFQVNSAAIEDIRIEIPNESFSDICYEYESYSTRILQPYSISGSNDIVKNSKSTVCNFYTDIYYSVNDQTFYMKYDVLEEHKIEITKIEGKCKLNSKTKFKEVKLLVGNSEEDNDEIKWEYSNILFNKFVSIFNYSVVLPSVNVSLFLNNEFFKFEVRTSKNCVFYAYFEDVYTNYLFGEYYKMLKSVN